MLRPFRNAGSTVGLSPGREQRTPHSVRANAPTPIAHAYSGFRFSAMRHSCRTAAAPSSRFASEPLKTPIRPPCAVRKKTLAPNTPGALPYS